MEWLENYLKGYSGAVLVVSHDRYFLDNVCTKIWEVSFQTMTTYKGNFSAYLPQKEAADALGISQSYISRLEKRIIQRLKKEILRLS